MQKRLAAAVRTLESGDDAVVGEIPFEQVVRRRKGRPGGTVQLESS